MSLTGFMARARARSLDRTPRADAWTNIYFSGTTLALWRVAAPLTSACSRGLVLDAGSGRGGWCNVIGRGGGQREPLDLVEHSGERLTWKADIMAMPEVPTDRYDAVVCHQVLEHVPDPRAALRELRRVLKPGGVAVLSVPHLSRLHEVPHDYYRYTPMGLAAILGDCGFDVQLIRPYGGLVCFLHHQVTTVALSLVAAWRPAYAIGVALNAPWSMLAHAIDRLIERNGRMPAGVVAVARKPRPDDG